MKIKKKVVDEIDKEFNYEKAIDFVSSKNALINSITKHLSFLQSPDHLSSLKKEIEIFNKKSTDLDSFISRLPDFQIQIPSFTPLENSRKALLSYFELSTSKTITDQASSIFSNLKQLVDETISSNSILHSSSFSDLLISNSLKSTIELMDQKNLTEFSIHSNLFKGLELSLFSEKSLAKIRWEDIGSKIGMAEYNKPLRDSFLNFSTNFSQLLKSFENNPISFTDLNPSISKIAPMEYFVGSNLLELISTDEEITTEEELLKNEIIYENQYALNLYLPKIHPGLFEVWKGAVEVFNSKHSDWVRHFTISLREIFTHIMQRLAPDDKINDWTNESKYYDKGKPTRKARLFYICRNLSNQKFNKFLEKDIEATLEFINLFQRGTHSLKNKFTPSQLIMLKSKAETTIKLLLEIEFSVNKNTNSNFN